MNPLEGFPLDFSRPQVQELRDCLARTFFRLREIEDLVVSAGLNPGRVDYSGTAELQWLSVLSQARAAQKIRPLLTAVVDRQPPLGPRIEELTRDQPVLQAGTGSADALSNPTSPQWRGFGAEKVVVEGSDTLLGVSFLEQGVVRSRSVCRVAATFPSGTQVHGTASLIRRDLLLTNHHVLHDWDGDGSAAVAVEAWFDYELDVAGVTRQLTVVPCAATSIMGQRPDDWAVVRTEGPVPDTSEVLSLIGAPAPRIDDYVFIIQHPEGGPKMIGLSHNLVRHVDVQVLQYWTDTKAGSSGAPVFDAKWRVVGLHHRWVPAPTADGVAYRNQGRRIEPVLGGLRALGVSVGG